MNPIKTITVQPPDFPLVGNVTPPGSKSITNRVLLLAALAEGTSRLEGALKSDDTHHMVTALTRMGVTIEEPDSTTFIVTSTGRLTAPETPLFLGNAGTAVRFLTAAVTTATGEIVLDGDRYMRKRPIAPLVDALNRSGLRVDAATGCPPVTVSGRGQLDTTRFEIDGGLSSQYVSALLMLAARGATAIDVALTGDDLHARGYVELTIGCMRAFGANVTQLSSNTWRVQATGYRAADYRIEPDASSATYLWAAEALTAGNIDLGFDSDAFTQPDSQARAIIARFPDLPGSIEGSQMQDAIPTVAVLAAFNRTPVRFTGIANLRVKECDRIQALHDGLNAIRPGLASIEGDDLMVNADPQLAGFKTDALIDTHSDHRIAMGFAIAGLAIEGIRIQDPDCVGKTYPGFWKALESIGVEINVG